jgi:hypothetical protein
MFLLRSAFWLAVAYVVSGPGPVDLGATANRLSTQAVTAGRELIAAQILGSHCFPLACSGGPAAGPIVPSLDTAMQDSSSLVPLPRPRPDRMG